MKDGRNSVPSAPVIFPGRPGPRRVGSRPVACGSSIPLTGNIHLQCAWHTGLRRKGHSTVFPGRGCCSRQRWRDDSVPLAQPLSHDMGGMPLHSAPGRQAKRTGELTASGARTCSSQVMVKSRNRGRKSGGCGGTRELPRQISTGVLRVDREGDRLELSGWSRSEG